jgi:hypothetical protein
VVCRVKSQAPNPKLQRTPKSQLPIARGKLGDSSV